MSTLARSYFIKTPRPLCSCHLYHSPLQTYQMSTTELPLLGPKHDYKPSRRQSVLTNYDPSAYPPDLQFARQHGHSQNVGAYIPPREDIERCPCCLTPIYKNPLPISCELYEFLHIGEAYPLYFHFIKQCIVLLLINILINSIPSLIINLSQGSMCVVLDGLVYNFYGLICKSSVINIMDVKEIDLLEIQAVMNIISIIVSIFMIGILEIKMEQKYQEYKNEDRILPKASDYSVLLKGLPKDITISQIRQFVQEKLLYNGAPDTTVLKIYIIYDLKAYHTLYSNKRNTVQKIAVEESRLSKIKQQIHHNPQTSLNQEKVAKLKKKEKESLEKISEFQNQKEMIENQINTYEQLFKLVVERVKNDQKLEDCTIQGNKIIGVGGTMSEGEMSQTNEEVFLGAGKKLQLKFSGKCIVTLKDRRSRNVLVKTSENVYFLQRVGFWVSEILGGTSGSIRITQAPEPSDIIFSNMGSQKIGKWKSWLCVTIFLSFLIMLDFVLLTLSKKFVKQQKAINKQNLIFSFLNSQLIALFNSIVSRVIRTSENSTQIHSSHSSYYNSITSKLVVLFLINMLVTTFFSNLVNYYLINEKTQTFDRFPLNFQEYLFDVFFLLITNPFISFFLIFVDHRQIYKYYKRMEVQKFGQPVTQAQANSYYQNMQVDLSNKYGNIYRFVLFSAGICFIYPPALIVCAASISVFYWMDKYLLLRRYVISHKVGFRLTRNLQKIMWMMPMLMASTNLVIMFVPIRDGSAFEEGKYSRGYYYASIVIMVLTIVIYFGGCNWVISFLKSLFFKDKNKSENPQISYRMRRSSRRNSSQREYPTYNEIQMEFNEDYWHHYPYFKVKKNKKGGKDEQIITQISPRKQKVLELRKKMRMDVFSVIKEHLHHDRYSPVV